jgi:signal transduction histidine kinase
MERSEYAFYADLARGLFAVPGVMSAADFRDKAVAGQPVDVQDLLGPSTQEATTAYGTYLNQAAERLQADADDIRTDAETAADEAARQAQGVIVLTSAVLALAVLVTVMASRSITRPLSRLVGAAENMANHALPQAVQEILETPLGEDVQVPELATIDDRGGYEIAEVASALNTVQDSATGLAVEQAVLRRNIADAFVNLGRRNQALLTRLLDAVTQMERQEADPDELQALFTLDHLATRMRRNAESLVVLAGVDARRQWSNPVAIVDVVRGALGEVEQYQRVDIVELDGALVSGSTVADLTHLVAELLENALQYSPPNRDVEIRGRAHPRGYELAIVDHGVGMPADELAVANTRLAGGESFTVAPSRYLGHYVVGRQATRLGLDVGLVDTPGGGTTATIEIGNVVSDEAPVETPAPEPEAGAGAAPEAAIAPPAEAEPEAEDEDVSDPRTPVSAPLDGRFVHRALAPRTAPVEQPATLAEALGTGNDSPVTAQAAVASSAPAPGTPPATPTTTGSGYARRVKGTHVPDTSVRAARNQGEARRNGGGAEGMRSALSSMQAGLKRSQSETGDDADDRSEEA